MSTDSPKPSPIRQHRPWSRGFFMERGPQINGSHLYYTTASTQGFLMPRDRREVMESLEPKKEKA